MKYCKLSDYAKKYGVTYRTAYNRFNQGKIEGAYMDDTGHICVPVEYIHNSITNVVTIYATVPMKSDGGEEELENQVRILSAYCNAKGYRITKVVREYAMNIMEERPKLNELLEDRNCKHIVVATKNSISRFDFEQIRLLLENDHREIEVMNNTGESREELIKTLANVIYIICRDIRGRRLPKRNIYGLIDRFILSNEDPNEADD